MAIINISGALVGAFPIVEEPVSIASDPLPALDTPPNNSTIQLTSGISLSFPSWGGEGGGSTRPSTGQIYPRGL